ncbi:hypothetical protein B5X24_HaOG217110 [Helicoverpa armigera]|uniref:Uncharacterized protein n=1 Tax=Helicoverpa armigera TaxID=29058 RepID=A0A2W1BYY2_HELAM|nr:hypothetical protein B5X24_HaOG217110 [Helicoverpa armigera]
MSRGQGVAEPYCARRARRHFTLGRRELRKKIYSTLSRARSSSNNILKTLSEKYDDPWLSHVMEVLVRRP